MLQQLSKENAFKEKVHLIFGTRTAEGILYRELFEKLEASEPNFSYDVVLSRDEDWKGYKGYVHQVYQEKYLDKASETDFYLCGWSNMVDEAIDILKNKMQVPSSNIYHELYG